MDNRTFLALFLCFMVIVGFQLVQQRGAQQTPTPETSVPGDTPPSGGPQPTTESAIVAPAPVSITAAAPAHPIAFDAPVKSEPIENDLVSATVSSQGAAVTDVRLKRYFAEDRTPLELLRPFALGGPFPALQLVVSPTAGVNMAESPWEMRPEERGFTFSRPASAAITVEKTLALEPDGFGMFVTLRFKNAGPGSVALNYTLFGAQGITVDDPTGKSPVYCVAGIDAGDSIKFDSTDATSLPEPNAPPDKRKELNTPTFGGTASKYFAVVLAPLTKDFQATFFAEQTEGVVDASSPSKHKNTRSGFRSRDLKIGSGDTITHRYLFYAGPKEPDILSRYDVVENHRLGLSALYDLSSRVPGGESLARLFLWILHALQRVTTSYGLAIILLTIMVRAALHPLNRLSQRSMYKMQKLAPKMKEIQEKYKTKKSKESVQKMQTEIMELQARHGAQPIWGCLPVPLQFPVFIGLYNSIAYAIELRQQRFLWIGDLSLPDRIMKLPFLAIGPLEGYLNVLPMLMVLTMVISQKLQPVPTDPQQAEQQKMMSWFTVIFGVLFYTVPSGLILYFLTSSILGIVEQRWVRGQIQREEALSGRLAPA